ncbi:thioesterase II family protein [Actinophytocola sp.]|uniref:thioesterase II family protein n=1 Tax=Actinophytocola sp. TaxID=1872138 RepID=UPI003D6AC433
MPKAGPARWFLRPVPAEATAALLCFPYAGVGGSSYRDWPATIGGMTVVPLQPPGRENRIREPRPETHQEFARSLAAALSLLDGKEIAFFGHCGAVPFMLATAFELAAAGAPLPAWIMASSWGAPQAGLYGPLNFVDLETYDFTTEVVEIAAGLGMRMSPELVGMAAEVFRHDHVVQRRYRYPTPQRVPVPVAAVGWSADDVVPPDVATTGWDEVATTRSFVLTGAHGDFLRCPENLQHLVARLVREPEQVWPANRT